MCVLFVVKYNKIMFLLVLIQEPPEAILYECIDDGVLSKVKLEKDCVPVIIRDAIIINNSEEVRE